MRSFLGAGGHATQSVLQVDAFGLNAYSWCDPTYGSLSDQLRGRADPTVQSLQS